MENTKNSQLLIAFYGDDFTGSTDALESLSNFGIKTVLFIEPPTEEQLSRYQDLQAIGVAGMSRSLSPIMMEEVLKPAFESLAKLNPKHIHYKVCSTFDSSPTVGSIGKAIDIGCEVFDVKSVPLLVAAPALGRYCLFGNLFAKMGIGSDGNIFRLDRHPSMSKHPITPANESDLRLHLAEQTAKNIGLFNILDLHQFKENLTSPKLPNHEIILFDALEQEDLRPIGLLIDSLTTDNIIFSVGSSGVGMALGAYWQQKQLVREKLSWPSIMIKNRILVVSGSCSAITAGQIAYALENGFVAIAIDTVSLARSANLEEDISSQIIDLANEYGKQAAAFIAQGYPVVVHTSLGMDDQRVIETSKICMQKKYHHGETAKLYGTLLGLLVNEVVRLGSIERIIVAGGDSSSYAARTMGVEAVEMIAPLSPGAPICIAHAPNYPIDQHQVVFKGGQVGKVDFFVKAMKI